MKIKRLIRNVITFFLYYTGLLHLLARLRFEDRAVVLMYHRVIAGEEGVHCYSQDGIIVSLPVFEQQMSFLRKHFNVLSLTEFLDRAEAKKAFDRKSCLVTFDDGWKDNFQNAYRVLKENGIPAVIFLTTDFVGSRELFWQEKIAAVLFKLYENFRRGSSIASELLQQLPDREIERILKSGKGSLRDEIARYVSRLKGKSKEEVVTVIQSLSELTGNPESVDVTEEAFMNWDEIRLMAENGISFGSHGKSHAILTRLGADEIKKEALESKARLETMLGIPVISFSYPNGDCSEEVIDIVRQSGYRAAFSTEEGTHSVNDNPYMVRRINIHGNMASNNPMFMARIIGLW